MPELSRSIAKCFLLSLFLTCGGAAAQSDREVVRLAAVNLSPVATAQHDGYLNLLLIELFSRIDVDVAFQNMPAGRVMMAVNGGLVDGDAGRLEEVGADLPNIVRLNDPLMYVEFGGLYTDAEISIADLEDFAPLRVGYLRGWVIAEVLFADHDSATSVRTVDSLLAMLAAGRIDVAFITRATGLEQARQRNLPGALFSEFRIRRDLHLFLNAQFEPWLADLSQALSEMHSDGAYNRIMSAYELTDD